MASKRTYTGLFMITLSTLMYEIALTRIFSVTMWYHFAFVAISVALFGMTVGALIVHHFPHRFPEALLRRRLWTASFAFAATIPICFITQLTVPLSPHATAVGLWSILVTCLVISVPFVLSGIVVALVLTRFPERVNRLYAADLIGAAIGCVVLVAMLQFLDGPSAVIAVAAFGALGAACFASDAGSRRGLRIAVVVAIGFGGFAMVNAHMVRNGGGALRIIWSKEAADTHHLAERWNAFSRVTVEGSPGSPTGIVIDSTAGTDMVADTPEATAALKTTIPNLVHAIRTAADVLVIGAGGGKDVRSALAFDQKSVTAVEINPLVLHFANDVYGDYTGHLDRDPRVHYVNDEARSYIARTPRKYDIIQISLIDTWAAQGAGAFALTENSLYTVEAWKLFFHRLQPGGVLSVTRFYEFPGTTGGPLEMYRTTALAAQALTEMGVKNPRDHIVIYRSEVNSLGVRLATILVSPDAFTQADLEGLAARSETLGFEPVLTPTDSLLPFFAQLAAPGGPGPVVENIPEDISPPTDNHPFFFQMANLRTFMNGRGFSDDFVTRPVLVLALLAIVVLFLALALILMPGLLAADRRQRRVPVSYLAYFGAIGFAFLFVEISQLQRLGLFLGNPTYSLAVVLFSVLLFSGIGSMATERFVRDANPRSFVIPLAVLFAGVLAFGIVSPSILTSNAGATTPARVAIAVAMLAPLSFGMGLPFVIGMRMAHRTGEPATAFLWGVNGAASVCASVFGVAIAVFFGIAATFWCGAVAYGVATVAMVVLSRRSAAVVDDAAAHGQLDAHDADVPQVLAPAGMGD